MNQIKKNKVPTLYVLIGIPGSGKSSYGRTLAETTGAVYLGSDAIRKELFGDEAIQKNSRKVFRLLQERTKECLLRGDSVVYDACNILSRTRKRLLCETLKGIPCKKRGILFATPSRVCVKQDSKRDRTVGIGVISNMKRDFEPPCKEEGFQDIRLLFSKDTQIEEDFLRSFLKREARFLPEEDRTLLQEIGREREELAIAYLLLSYGKRVTKNTLSFEGEKRELFPGAGGWAAYDALFLPNHSEESLLSISRYIVQLQCYESYLALSEEEKEGLEVTFSKEVEELRPLLSKEREEELEYSVRNE